MGSSGSGDAWPDNEKCKVSQLTVEHSHGPAVGDDMVHREEQYVFFRAQPQERCPKEWPRVEIERTFGLLAARRSTWLPARTMEAQSDRPPATSRPVAAL